MLVKRMKLLDHEMEYIRKSPLPIKHLADMFGTTTNRIKYIQDETTKPTVVTLQQERYKDLAEVRARRLLREKERENKAKDKKMREVKKKGRAVAAKLRASNVYGRKK